MKKYYFDYNSTCFTRSEVVEVMKEISKGIGNPSSAHQFGKDRRKIIEKARSSIANYLKINPKRIIFTSGATESNNIAISGFEGKIIVCATEHSSVFKACPNPIVCPVDENGYLCMDILEAILQENLDKKILVCVSAANNETGVIQPIHKTANLVHQYGGFILCDAVQGIGRMIINWADFDMISFSGHKVGGPFGIGLLVVNPEVDLKPIIKGGAQEGGLRPGTHNLTGIVGLAKALELCCEDDWNILKVYRDSIENEIYKFCPSVIYPGSSSMRLPNTSMIYMPNVPNHIQLKEFDKLGIAVSTGSACNSGNQKLSRVLIAMGFAEEVVRCCIRVSLGFLNNKKAVEYFVDSWKIIYNKFQGQ